MRRFRLEMGRVQVRDEKGSGWIRVNSGKDE